MSTIYKYEVRLANQAGTEIKTLTNIHTLKLARVVNDMGSAELSIPNWNDYDDFKPDSRFAVYRSIAGEPLKLVGETIWIVTGRKRIRKNKQEFLVIYAYDANYLLMGRTIDYAAGTSQAAKTATIDNMMKEIVRENLGSSATNTDRQISVLTVAANTSTAPQISKAFSNKNVLAVLQELAQSSFTSGTYLAFDLFCHDVNTFEFRTYPNVRGIDRRYESNNVPVIIDAEINLGDFELFEDYSKAVSTIIAGGQGEASSRNYIRVTDSTRLVSNISRREKFIDGRNSTEAQLIAEANTALRNYRPKTSFIGDFIQTSNLLFGRDINFGDYLPVQIENLIIDCRIDAFALSLNSKGLETIKIVLRADD